MDIGNIWAGWETAEYRGEGSFGKVYRITRNDFGHTYESALKVITIPANRGELASVLNDGFDEESATMYFRSMVEDIVDEFALMSRLRGNSNIVSYEDHAVVTHENEIGWDIYIRMELLTPLFEHMKQHPLSVRDVILLGIHICRALEVCQNYNIIHRDIKPGNIFISELGQYKLGDFGIARQLEKTSSGLSKKGTYDYMAPEVYKGEEYNATVDIYSLGIVLYRFLNHNRNPFLPPYPNPVRISDKEQSNRMRFNGIKMEPPCNAKGRLAEIVMKACAYHPKERYKNARDMREALQEILDSEQEEDRIDLEGDLLQNDVDFSVFAATQSDESEQEIEILKIEDTEKTRGLFGQKYKERYAFEKKRQEEEQKKADEEQQREKERRKEAEEEQKRAEEAERKAEKEQKESAEEAGKAENEDNRRKTQDVQKRGKRKSLLAGSGILAAIAAGVLMLVWIPKNNQTQVPDFLNLDMVQADTQALENQILLQELQEEYSDTVEKGKIISQDIKAGTAVKKESVVKVVVSKGKSVTVPDVARLDQAEAKQKLSEFGLDMKIGEEVYSDIIEAGAVVSQSPVPGEVVGEETEILLVLSKGIEQTKVPDVAGLSRKDAKAALTKANLKMVLEKAYSSEVGKGKVVSQSVEEGTLVATGTEIRLVISQGPKPEKETPETSGNTPVKQPDPKTRTPEPPQDVPQDIPPQETPPQETPPQDAPAPSGNEENIDTWDLVN